MNVLPLTRRQLLTCAGLAVALPAPASANASQVSFPGDHEEALQRLIEGNRRFAVGETRHAHEGANWRKQLVNEQKPFATILGCSDSRVPVELVFDQGFGDLFVVRVAGNVIAPDVVGSLAYALVHLATPVVVVLGHEGCGAVTAAMQASKKPSEEPLGIKGLLELIQPGLPDELPGDTPEQRVNAAVEANVRWSMKQLSLLPEAKKALAAKRFSLQGAVYELTTGKVRFLSN